MWHHYNSNIIASFIDGHTHVARHSFSTYHLALYSMHSNSLRSSNNNFLADFVNMSMLTKHKPQQFNVFSKTSWLVLKGTLLMCCCFCCLFQCYEKANYGWHSITFQEQILRMGIGLVMMLEPLMQTLYLVAGKTPGYARYSSSLTIMPGTLVSRICIPF